MPYTARTHIGEPAKAGPLTLDWTGPREYDTAEEAWNALADHRVDLEDEADAGTDDPWGVTRDVSALMDRREPGDVWLADPGHDDSDDMHAGRTYIVSEQ